MTVLSIIYVVLFYVAIIVLFGGIANKIMLYKRVPAPLKIPVTPAPLTTGGVVYRLFYEVVFFNSLFRGNKWTWIFGWIFHLSLLLAFFRHLRYLISPDVFFWPLINNMVVQSFGHYAGFTMLIGLAGLFARRILVDRVRYISSASDYLMLLLIMGIAGSGLMIVYASHTDIIQLKAFIMGLFLFDPQNLPADPILLAHITMVLFLAVIFPVSKLLHAPGLFFAPTRNQIDNPREKRHLSEWGAAIEAEDGRNN
ncbi:MAG: respiratory nitrate reductase subunit gamma [Gammaproteobacteria bacterium]|nr:respiratory nitrate reductase subunit gamma [Gammaproteobacteria bacterium]MCW8923730.1 respiratory nitrate reductase subunit gamma [Gammaproteobacteria bacterium]